MAEAVFLYQFVALCSFTGTWSAKNNNILHFYVI